MIVVLLQSATIYCHTGGTALLALCMDLREQ